MPRPPEKQLAISSGQYSDKGRKPLNQDFHGLYCPAEPLLSAKGIAVALADGIGSSAVSQIASETAVAGFLADYYSTPESWSVKNSARRVLEAINSWLHAETRRGLHRYDKDKGYVCTFSGIVFKSATAHLFHAGDARIYRLRGDTLEALTQEHRLRISEEETCLSRALGLDNKISLDYMSLPLREDDTFLLVTDGVHEFVGEAELRATLDRRRGQLHMAARLIADQAIANHSPDNVTVQIVRLDKLPDQNADEARKALRDLPFPPDFRPRLGFDGYTLLRPLHQSDRSRLWLAVDDASGAKVVIKTPAGGMRADPAYLERFLFEEWIARRIDSAHVQKPCQRTRKRHYFYIASEYIAGQTLRQWMLDHPAPRLETVHDIIEQVARGLRAFHRLEMLHQDLRPENIMLDTNGTARIIDFGSARVAGIEELDSPLQNFHIPGTAQYAAPEYFLGEHGTEASDQFSLAVIAYEMLSGGLPYGAEVAKTKTRRAQRKLVYRSVLGADREIPAWVDAALCKAAQPDPLKRYAAISEFLRDLRHPNPAFINKTRPPLLEARPLLFWRGLALILGLIIIFLLYTR